MGQFYVALLISFMLVCSDGEDRVTKGFANPPNPGSSLQLDTKSWLVSICGTFPDPKNHLTLWFSSGNNHTSCDHSGVTQMVILPLTDSNAMSFLGIPFINRAQSYRGWSFLDFSSEARPKEGHKVENWKKLMGFSWWVCNKTLYHNLEDLFKFRAEAQCN